MPFGWDLPSDVNYADKRAPWNEREAEPRRIPKEGRLYTRSIWVLVHINNDGDEILGPSKFTIKQPLILTKRNAAKPHHRLAA